MIILVSVPMFAASSRSKSLKINMFKRWNILLAFLCFDNVFNSRNESGITSGKPIRQSSCAIGWFSYGDMCYKMGDGKLSWEQASERCYLDYNGNLVAIHSKEFADFVTAFFLLSVRHTMWIGLHDRVTEGAYIWDDESALDYKNWAEGEPSGEPREWEDCVELPFHNANSGREMGQWNDGSCDQKLPFICQKKKGSFNSDYLDPRFCSSDLGGGWKQLTSCYNFVNESKTWAEAEKHCVEKFTGHLVTIPDLATELFLNYILGDEEKKLWIGIRTQNGNVQQWSSGWHVAYENWELGESEFIEGRRCAARSEDEEWVNLPCDDILPFVCEYSIAVPPTLKPNIEGATCPELLDDWIDLGGDYCYFFETELHYTWLNANFFCMKRAGSSLISIHSQEEVSILHNFIKFKQNAVYIGLYRQNKNTFAWVDGSPLNYSKWDANEPSSPTEECVEMRTGDMRWNDVDCTQLKGYICSIPKILPNQTHEQQDLSSPCLNGYSGSTLAAVIFCVLIVAVLTGVVTHYYCNFFDKKYERFKKTSGAQFESASYKKPKDKTELFVIEGV